MSSARVLHMGLPTVCTQSTHGMHALLGCARTSASLLMSYLSGKMPVSVRRSEPTMSTGLRMMCCTRWWCTIAEKRLTKKTDVSVSVMNMKTYPSE